MMKEVVLWFFVFTLVGLSYGQDCPSAQGWLSHGSKCYKFLMYPRLTYLNAARICQEHGATLVSPNEQKEHNFIQIWLIRNDPRRHEWWTSGRMDGEDLYWEGDGSSANYAKGWIISTSANQERQNNLVYSYHEKSATFGLKLADRFSPQSFICEISRQEVYRISQEVRGFDYGLSIQNPSQAPRGPTFVQEPESVTILGQTKQMYFDCVADGNPGVEYEWLRRNSVRQMVPIVLEGRYSTTSGRLNILNPDENKDEGVFQCRASNEHGTIISAQVELTFGSISNFSAVPSSAVEAEELNGAQLNCPPINGKPGLTYQWYKNSPTSFIRPNIQTHTFISASGKLLFSEVAESDGGTYYCIASLTSFGLSRNYIGSSQSQSKLSPGFDLKVKKSSGNEYDVAIQEGFINVYPPSPMRGGTVQLECFAYGSLPLTYSWGKKNRPFPEGRHKFTSANRILIIYNVDLSDEDIYYCNVSSSKSNSKQSTSQVLSILAKPYFVSPLQHQHVDIGSHLTWYCEAMGKPFPVYTWYKNGKRLTSEPGVTVTGNTLTIESLDSKRDNGMYQCGASNDVGETISTAQLRVLEIPPSFEKNPMPKLVNGAIGGSVTLHCNPIGAPRPTFSWVKDGSVLSLSPGQYQPDDHHRLLLSGDLVISQITEADAGRYVCKVENSKGSAEDYTVFSVNDRVEFYKKPEDLEGEVNMTFTLMCQASYGKSIDMVYIWSFNDHVIDFEVEPEYRLGQIGTQEEGYLYINNAQFRNEGWYTCAIVSSSDRQESSAYVEVNGPPGEVAGVRVSESPIGGLSIEGIQLNTTRWVTWMDGETHGEPISHYFVQFRTEFDMSWRVHPDGLDIPVARTQIDSKPYIRYARLTNLKAGTGIEFRVIARNVYGLGTPSLPTAVTRIIGAAPIKAVEDVRGGGGKVRDLTFWWKPLPREDHNGPGLKYIVRWRLHRDQGKQDKWSEKNVTHEEACRVAINIELGKIYVCQHVELVDKDLFYTEYDATIQAVNNYGRGPMTKPTIILSAEALPQGSPTNVYARVYNATALNVTWNPIPNTRARAGGTLKGYKINYWRRDFETQAESLQNIIELKKGQENLAHGLIIGLEPVTWYAYNVQAYNLAGNGLKSTDNVQQTLNRVPENFPTEVYIYSIEGKGVQVNFRGVSTQAREEPLKGYKVQIWKSTENIRSAREYDLGKANSGVIRGLNSSELYQLRVFAYSRAGQGKRSSPTVYFTVGDGQILANPETTEIMSGVTTLNPSVLVTLVSTLVLLCLQLLGRRD